MKSYDAGLICPCCALSLANGDTSGCEEYCGDAHVERLCQFGLEPGEGPVVGEDVGCRHFTCAGCGDATVGDAFVLVVLHP